MQDTFINHVLNQLSNRNIDLVETRYVVPSRRVGLFLNKEISKRQDQSFFEPITQSIGDFIQELSGLHILDDLEILPFFYTAYCNVESVETRDTFDSFIGWAPSILQDFNEIDRYLVNESLFFDYLGNFKALDSDRHWSLDASPTPMVSRYLDFWKKLRSYYLELQRILMDQNLAYQGLAYRVAYKKSESGEANLNNQETIVFLGLNALNTAESKIIELLLGSGKALIFWDTDSYFINNKFHEAGKFINEYYAKWDYYKKNTLEIIGSSYQEEKLIEIISVTGNLGMVQAAREQIALLSEERLKETVVILADEQLLLPLINAIPDNVLAYNITMGLSLDNLPISSFFTSLFKLHKESIDGTFYYKNVIEIMESSIIHSIAGDESLRVLTKIRGSNLIKIEASDFDPINFPFTNYLLIPIKHPKEILFLTDRVLKDYKTTLVNKKNSQLDLEQLLAMVEVMEELKELIRDNSNIKDLRTLLHLLRQLLPLKKLDFIGEPIKGLQIMGLLETRALDFKNIIMLSVNEGTLPAGKTFSSYIPHEMKRTFSLPTYTDKDSIYAYHFYRLLHRCNQATFIYNSQSDTLGGGEKSRFLLQLERGNNTFHQIKKIDYYHKVNSIPATKITIEKEPQYFIRLKEIAEKGFSPSALSSYIRNPIEFFSNKIMGISAIEDVEEDIAMNTMGSIIHEALDRLYANYQEVLLTPEIFEVLKKRIKSEVDLAYKKHYKSQSLPVGKNKIVYEVSLHYVKKMIHTDEETVKSGQELIIKSVEQDLSTMIEVPNIGSVKIHGKVDRVDSLNGLTRIIDYKSGSVNQRNVSIDQDYQVLIEDYERSKAFQVLMYAYLYLKNNPSQEIEAGIISFKNFNSGFISFSTKPKNRFEKQLIDNQVVHNFENQLFILIQELFDPSIALIEKEL